MAQTDPLEWLQRLNPAIAKKTACRSIGCIRRHHQTGSVAPLTMFSTVAPLRELTV